MPSTLSRAEFAELVASAVEAVGIESANGRVHVVPGERMLRYYTTQGVMDRPELALTANGKEARYGRRHLLQFVAAKRLQAGGASLPDIRDRLARVTDNDLERLAAIPAGVIPPDLADVDAPTPPAARPPFWRHRPERDGSAALLAACTAADDEHLAQPAAPVFPAGALPRDGQLAQPAAPDAGASPRDGQLAQPAAPDAGASPSDEQLTQPAAPIAGASPSEGRPASTSHATRPGSLRVAAAPANEAISSLPPAAAGAVRSGVAGPSIPLAPSLAPVPHRTVTVVTLGPGIEVHIDTAVHSPAQVELLVTVLANAIPTLPASREES